MGKIREGSFDAPFEMMNIVICSKEDLNELERLRVENKRLRAALRKITKMDCLHVNGYKQAAESALDK